jgi:hypothetical protein
MISMTNRNETVGATMTCLKVLIRYYWLKPQTAHKRWELQHAGLCNDTDGKVKICGVSQVHHIGCRAVGKWHMVESSDSVPVQFILQYIQNKIAVVRKGCRRHEGCCSPSHFSNVCLNCCKQMPRCGISVLFLAVFLCLFPRVINSAS